VRSRLGPNVDGVAGRIQRSELLPSRDALRPEYRARRHPFVAGVASATVANVGVGASGDEGPLVSGERPVLTQVRSMGL